MACDCLSKNSVTRRLFLVGVRGRGVGCGWMPLMGSCTRSVTGCGSRCSRIPVLARVSMRLSWIGIRVILSLFRSGWVSVRRRMRSVRSVMLVVVRLVGVSVSRSAGTEPVLLCAVVGEPGGGVAMCPDLRDPLPSATYTVDGKFHYTTDEWGRTVRLQVDRLDVVPEDARYRYESAQKRIGHYGDGLGGGYDGGHLAGAEYGGPPEDINVWLLEERNRGIGDTYAESFKALEDANSEESRRLPQYRHPHRVRWPGPPPRIL